MRAKYISNERRELLENDAETSKLGLSQQPYHHPKIAALFWKRLLLAEKSDITPDDWQYAANLAGSWNTCACGSVNDGLPRDWDKDQSYGTARPTDETLQNLGMAFYRQIENHNLPVAQRTFLKIQERSAEVLEEMRLKNEG